MNNRMNTIISKMINLQNELNTLYYPNWINELNSNDFNIAILDEASELLNSIDWKWWNSKKREVDIENIKIEIIDLWHFLLSLLIIESNNTNNIIFNDSIQKIITLKEFLDLDKKEKRKFIGHFLLEITNNKLNIEKRIIYLIKFSLTFFESLEKLFKKYTVKVVLNKFRYNNGYRNNKYIKIWNGEEDNKVALKLFEKINFNQENLDKVLYEMLEKYYKENVLKK